MPGDWFQVATKEYTKNLPSKPKQLLNLAVASDATLSRYQLRLMIWLIDHAHHKTGSCFPSDETLLVEMGVSTERKRNDKHYLKKNLSQLKTKGWISKMVYDNEGRRFITLARERALKRKDKPLAQSAEPTEADHETPVGEPCEDKTNTSNEEHATDREETIFTDGEPEDTDDAVLAKFRQFGPRY
jgi:hypothetical protein